MEICVVNGCVELVDHATAQRWVDAIQRQVAIDFASVWGLSATLHYAGDGIGAKPSPTNGIIRIVRNSSTPGTLGTHWYTDQPTGECSIQDCLNDNVKPSSCLDHEILEMIGDPDGSQCFIVNGKAICKEMSDRVEGSDSSYTLDGVDLENWSLLSAFTDGPGPWDFRRVLSSNIIAPTGYQLYYDFQSRQWTQVTGALARRTKRHAAEASRRAARMKRAGADASKLVVVSP